MLDSALPQLDIAFDTTRMRDVLAGLCLLEEGYEARACHIRHVRHRPSRNCLIRYELELFDTRRSRTMEQSFCARVYPLQASEVQWKKALGGPLVAAGAARPVTHVDGLGMVVWAFPNERKLRGLDAFLDPARLAAELLTQVLPGERVRTAQSELVRYMPEQGCTFRITAELEKRTAVLYAKSYPDQGGERTWRWMQAIYAQPRQHLIIAKPVAYLPESRTLWTEALPAPEGGDLSACFRALAELHAITLPDLPAAAASATVLWNRLSAVGDAMPELKAVAEEIERRLERQQARPAATLHGDLHRQNFLLYGDRAALLDLDTLQHGDPLQDLGSLLSSTPEAAEFWEAYGPTDRHDLATHTAFALVAERICRSFTRLKKRDSEALIERARRMLDETATARDVMARFERLAHGVPGEPFDISYRTFKKRENWSRSHVTVAYRHRAGITVRQFGGDEQEFAFPHDPAIPWLAEAIDPARVRPHLPLPAGEVAVEVVNYRPGNRCTTRYRVAQHGLFGKTYSDDRGQCVDERLRALWNMQPGEEFPMPEPLGYSTALRTVWQAEYSSVPLTQELNARSIAQAGARLAYLHASGIPCAERPSLEAQWLDLRKKLAKLSGVLPELAARWSRLVEILSNLPDAPTRLATVHSDFHLRQLQVRGGQVALFDFDETGLGDPAEDFGYFAADLHTSGFDPKWCEALWAGYGQVPDRQRIQWHTAVQLLTRAYRGLLQLRPDFEARAHRLTQVAENEVAG